MLTRTELSNRLKDAELMRDCAKDNYQRIRTAGCYTEAEETSARIRWYRAVSEAGTLRRALETRCW